VSLGRNEASEPKGPEDGVAHTLSQSVRKIRTLDLGLLEPEIVSKLMGGRRTRNELVVEIFQAHRGQDDYVASYGKIRRSLKRLQGLGYVSTPLFGKERPYKLTRYAIEKLASITPDLGPPTLVEKTDIAAYLACIILGSATLLVLGASPDPDRVLAILPLSFVLMLGFSIARIWETLRKVI